VPHDPDPRALSAVRAQKVQGAAVEDALLDRVLLAGGAHGELAELVREDEAADRGADAEEEGAVGEYEERVPRGPVEVLVDVVRLVFDERQEVDLDDYEECCLLGWVRARVCERWWIGIWVCMYHVGNSRTTTVEI
jgi:hypothetical protein